MQLSLRTLLMVLALAPLLLAGGWFVGNTALAPREGEWVTCDRPVVNISWSEAVKEVEHQEEVRRVLQQRNP